MVTGDAITDLALAAGRGDRTALSEFIRATQGDVWRYIARTAGRRWADDLTQETYLRVLEALPGFEARSSVRAWLLVIARRVVVDRIRQDLSRPRLAAVDWVTQLDDRRAHADPSAALGMSQLLARLHPERREALVLTQLMGFSYAETAEICGCAIGTVRSRVARARADLVAALQRERLDVP